MLVGEGAEVTLTRYNQTFSCYLPVYGEIEKQVARFLLDKEEAQALDFMTQEKFRAPGYLFANYATPVDSADSLAPLPFDTAGMDSQLKATRLKEFGEALGHDRNPPEISDRVPNLTPDSTVADSAGKR